MSNDLGVFLRARREALTPAEVGLPAGPRRRASGLRRSEVAALADVSVEYVTRLEQGHDRRPSAQVLAALAEALRLTVRERIHLYELAKAADPSFSCLGRTPLGRDVRPTVQALLDRLADTPAALLNRVTDILAWTTAYDRVMAPVGLLAGSPPNLARFVFTDPRARAAYPDWGHVADELVATLKRGPFRADAHIAVLADELAFTAGEEFTTRTDTVPGLPRPSGVTRLAHPESGELRLAYEILDLPADDDQRLIVHLPADAVTSAAMNRLAGRPLHPLGVASGLPDNTIGRMEVGTVRHCANKPEMAWYAA